MTIFTIKREWPLILIVLLPFVYLAFIWNELPASVPVHWKLNGEVNRYGNKQELILIPVLLSLLTYVILLVVPKIDPKNRIDKMGNKYHQLKFILVLLMSFLSIYIIYMASNESAPDLDNILLILGVLYIVFGNYFQTVKPNYFIGIRIPWTLENETVWHETHKLGGKLWFIGGLLIVATILLFPKDISLVIFIVITVIIILIPVVYSYNKFKNLAE